MHLNQQTGFSLPELMVAIALLGGISLFTMNIISEQKGNEVYITARSEIQKAKSLIQTAIADADNCRLMLNDQILSPSPNGTELASLVVPIKRLSNTSRELLRAHTLYSGFKVDTIKIVDDSNVPTVPEGVGGEDTYSVLAHFEIQFRIKSRSLSLWSASNSEGPNDKLVIEKLPLLVSLKGDGSRRILDCSPPVSDSNIEAKKKFCLSLGGAASWDDTNSICKFNNQTCPYGQVLVRMTSLGGLVCKNIKDTMNLNDLFSGQGCTSTGKLQIINDNGKLRISCPP